MASGKNKPKHYRRYLEPENESVAVPSSTVSRWEKDASQSEECSSAQGRYYTSEAPRCLGADDWREEWDMDIRPGELELKDTPHELDLNAEWDSPGGTREYFSGNNCQSPIENISRCVNDTDCTFSYTNCQSDFYYSSAGSDNCDPCYSSDNADPLSDCNSDGGDPIGSDPESDHPTDDGNSDAGDGRECNFFRFDDHLNETLAEGVQTSKAEAVLMVLSFVMRHALTSVALVNLLELINSLFGRPVLMASKYLFNKIFMHKTRVSFHFYCVFCEGFVLTYGNSDESIVPCPHCHRECKVDDLSNGNFFMTCALVPQLQTFLQKPDVQRNINYRFERSKINERNIEDVFDGEVYANMCKAGNPLSNSDNFSYSFNSDGMPVFNSAKYSLWPIYLMVNELPPKLRKENLILAGVWFGKSEPLMTIFLDKFVEEAQKLSDVGVTWKRGNTEVTSKFFALCCCVDAPARAQMQNTVQFNGYFGCSQCYHPGKIVDRTVKYPVDVCAYTEREEEEMLQDMEAALNQGRPVRGVKGPTPLINLRHFNIVKGFPPDFMHCLLLGVTRQMCELWLDPPATKDCYIGSPSNLVLIDETLSNIQPPSIVSRTPRSIKERKYWKASEWCNWLLYFALPSLLGILPNSFYRHFCILIEASFLLLQKSVSHEDVNRADLLLLAFVTEFQMLYGSQAMTFNVHTLTHLAQSVKSWGPLWTHSCFPFEAANGEVKKLLKGNKAFMRQATEKFILMNALPSFYNIYPVSERVQQFCERLLYSKKQTATPTEILGNVELFGTNYVTKLTVDEQNALHDLGYFAAEVLAYDRMKIFGFIFNTVGYRKSNKRNNHIIGLFDGRVGELLKIVKLQDECVVLFREFVVCHENRFSHTVSGAKITHIMKVSHASCSIAACTADSVLCNCIYIAVHDKIYVCRFPNYFSMC